MLFQAQQGLKNSLLNQNQQKPNAVQRVTSTLNIPLEEDEVLGPTPPEDHHHISKDVRHKVDVLKWLADNRQDPALKVNHYFINHRIQII
jgi:hypothetical protein